MASKQRKSEGQKAAKPALLSHRETRVESRIGRGPRTSRSYSEHHSTPASRAGEMVTLHLEHDRFAHARRVIDWYESERKLAARAAGPLPSDPLASGLRSLSVAAAISTPLAQIVGARLANALEAAGCLVVDDLAALGLSREQVLGLKNVGRGGLAELEAGLASIGLAEFFQTPPAHELAEVLGERIEKAGVEAKRRERARGHEG